MRNIFCRASVLLTALAMLSGLPAVQAQDVCAGQLEESLMKYILCYEAYKEAKQSDKPEVRAELANYIKSYREAYAEYLELLHQAELYEPDKKPIDPANDYNKSRIGHGHTKVKWGIIQNDSYRKQIKNGIKNGHNHNQIMKSVGSGVSTSSVSKEEEPELEEDTSLTTTGTGAITDMPSAQQLPLDENGEKPKGFIDDGAGGGRTNSNNGNSTPGFILGM